MGDNDCNEQKKVDRALTDFYTKNEGVYIIGTSSNFIRKF